MTIIVGVKCKDGVVIGADSKATSAMGPNPLVLITSNDKLQPIGNKGFFATTGSVGLSQRLRAITDRMWADKKFNGDCIQCSGKIARAALEDFQNTGVPMTPQHGLNFGALMGIVLEDKPFLIEFGTTDFQPEIKKDRLFYVAIGSGQLLADPFLAFVSRVLWNGEEPDVNLAKMGVYWVLDHTIKYAPGGVGEPIILGVIRRSGSEWKTEIAADTQEQAQFIAELEANLSPREKVTEAPTSPLPKAG